MLLLHRHHLHPSTSAAAAISNNAAHRLRSRRRQRQQSRTTPRRRPSRCTESPPPPPHRRHCSQSRRISLTRTAPTKTMECLHEEKSLLRAGPPDEEGLPTYLRPSPAARRRRRRRRPARRSHHFLYCRCSHTRIADNRERRFEKIAATSRFREEGAPGGDGQSPEGGGYSYPPRPFFALRRI